MQKEVQENLALVEKSIAPFVAKIESITIVDEATKMTAAEFLGEIKKRYKAVDSRRKERVEPLRLEVNEINNSYKIWLEKLDRAARFLNDGLVRYVDEQERKARIAAEKIRLEAAAKQAAEDARIAAIRAAEDSLRKEAEATKNAEDKARLQWEADNKQDEAVLAEHNNEEALATMEMPVVQEPEKTVRTHAGVFSVKKVWNWEVTDEKMLRNFHPELFVLDEKAVNKLMREGQHDIAGIRFFQVSQGATRA